ncbi:phosphoribosylanthranilate isomerase [Pradoshia sp.]
MEIVTKRSWEAEDLDIHVPGDQRGWEVPPEDSVFRWKEIMDVMHSLGYTLIDLHEHAFSKEGLSVEFGIIDTLPTFAGVELEDLALCQERGTEFYLLNLPQYLRVYEASAKDSYRADQNNHKDIGKMDFLKDRIKMKGAQNESL